MEFNESSRSMLNNVEPGDEAKSIMRQLASFNPSVNHLGMERLRDDFLTMSGKTLLQLQKNLEPAADMRGMTNPLSTRLEVDNSRSYSRFTGNEFVVLTNPYDDKVEMTRATQEHSAPADINDMRNFYFNSRVQSMVNHYAEQINMENEKLASAPRHRE